MKIRFHGHSTVHDAHLAAGSEVLDLGYRIALVVSKPDGGRVFVPPEMADGVCVVVWATSEEWQALAEHGYARKASEEQRPTDGEIPF
jgi:hypothetical protein